MAKKLQVLWRWGRWLFLALVVSYLTFGEGLKDLILGRALRKSLQVFEVRNVTEVRVYLLQGTDEQRTGETFRNRVEGEDMPVCASTVLKGPELEAFRRLWEAMIPDKLGSGYCHAPAYGFRLYSGSRLQMETSVCWGCGTYSVDVWPFWVMKKSFDSKSPEAQQLLAFCDKLMPYQRSRVPENRRGKAPWQE